MKFNVGQKGKKKTTFLITKRGHAKSITMKLNQHHFIHVDIKTGTSKQTHSLTLFHTHTHSLNIFELWPFARTESPANNNSVFVWIMRVKSLNSTLWVWCFASGVTIVAHCCAARSTLPKLNNNLLDLYSRLLRAIVAIWMILMRR